MPVPCTSPAGPCVPATGSGAIDTLVDIGVDQQAEILLSAFVSFSAQVT